MADELERLLTHVPASFPRPDPDVSARARRRVLSRPPRRPRRLGLAAALTVVALIAAAFTLGRWLVPARGIAATSITFDIKPRESEAWFSTVNGYGAVGNGKDGEDVVIESRECDGYGQWSTAAKATTGNGGTWIAQLGATSNATFRARWHDSVSQTIVVRVHPHVQLNGPIGGDLFRVSVAAGRFFDGSRGVIERSSAHGWIRLRAFTLHRSSGMGQVPWSYARVRAHVKHGTLVRAVLPRPQVGRCYLAGTSNIVRA